MVGSVGYAPPVQLAETYPLSLFDASSAATL
jgi:hypothetical protein